MINTYLKFDITDYLNFETRLGASREISQNFYYEPIYEMEVTRSNTRNYLRESSSIQKYWQIENLLSWNRNLGNHSFNTVVGQSSQSNSDRWIQGQVEGMPTTSKYLGREVFNHKPMEMLLKTP